MMSTYIKYLILLFVLNKINSSVLSPFQRNRLSLVDWNSYNNLQSSGAGSYAFGYDIQDTETSNVQFRNEERHPNGTVTGSYGYLQPDGNVQKVTYTADQLGYRASVEIIPRASLKPIKINRPETQLLDFSAMSSLFRQGKRVRTEGNMLPEVYPQNVPNYISKHLDKSNFSPGYRIEKNGFVPYFPRIQSSSELYKKHHNDYYVIPLY